MVGRPIVERISSSEQSLTDRAIRAIRDAINDGALVPGELYSVKRLADELGVSRSPARDALLRLEETGVIKFERNRGFRITMPLPTDLAEMFAVRMALECPAAAAAAAQASHLQRAVISAELEKMREAAITDQEALFQQHDQLLHRSILEAAGNQHARKIVESIRDATRLVGASTFENFRTLREVYHEHVPIVDAVLAGNASLAAQAMGEHLTNTGQLLIRKALGDSTGEAARQLWAAKVYLTSN
ncbi:GntR family transcriptional regulator [Mycobacterium sp. C3-094]